MPAGDPRHPVNIGRSLKVAATPRGIEAHDADLIGKFTKGGSGETMRRYLDPKSPSNFFKGMTESEEDLDEAKTKERDLGRGPAAIGGALAGVGVGAVASQFLPRPYLKISKAKS